MRGRQHWMTAVLVVLAAAGILVFLSAALPAAARRAGSAAEETAGGESGGGAGQSAEQAPPDNPAPAGAEEPFAARLTTLSYYTIQVREPSGGVYYAGFAQEEKPLDSWLTAIEEGGLAGKVVELTFPAGPLALTGESPGYLPELFLILNQQLRHLARAADFFGNSWQEISGQTVTVRRLDLLREEAAEVAGDLEGLAAYDSALAELEACGKLRALLGEWQELLKDLSADSAGKSFWPAQQKALELLTCWQSLLEQIGFREGTA